MDFFGSGLKDLLISIGLFGAWLILFAESGLLIGFFLPGDSLLFTAGLLASQGHFSVWVLAIGGTIAAIIGNQVGYYLGHKFGPRIFRHEDSVFFHKDHIERAKTFYAKYGPVTLILSRFTPIIRTFVPILAGVGGMDRTKFALYNIVGGILWVFGVSLAGYYLGKIIPDIDKFILPIIAAIVLFSVLPTVITYLKHRARKN
ncbi:hypothetical protein A3A71_03170 [Candidatus Berkelbacteria bacterium RIFCSPLOWO2_01_FULL_50_28]|uniref:VTT domain-containing protein n=1 Tax=Candidatus Berkelbacteria bacterium RIFCSPLOWO2_01_FULL_50_28 TaxID=1797471 RepID=A0A1F5ECF5_9BACT|nr:MAG: hypothetical protein A2807_02735 [Candidatus Berkelbacteria bacterium RIFCSPHIGHO2_01_FULL_50_36]OGD63792.1 MAG: hypothetical protein A3F39_03570 [Candidatus Berkelbacteria bacterium RIFCSPHIGHO2_12_FULL_50_11]OGD65065.1 MAG: hypothetical protein A3A71_03170 [Candidatus Berkelbacteria bacterium RIFCSPLOWO2_01_FULL_50_28]